MTKQVHCPRLLVIIAVSVGLAFSSHAEAKEMRLTRSARSGNWSDSTTWESSTVPMAGDVVLIRQDHHVLYDVDQAVVLRAVHISGVLEFSRDRDTTLEAGLIKVQAGERTAEEGFDCEPHAPASSKDERAAAALIVGTAAAPIPAEHTSTIRLHYLPGMDPKSCPALVCCGGRMELHGAPMRRTWVKLHRSVYPGDARVFVDEAVADWKPGDHLIVTGTVRQDFHKGNVTESVADAPQTELARLAEHVNVAGQHGLLLQAPLSNAHFAEGEFRAEVANLSRNVVIESADPTGHRGHTMYHRNSRGSISFAEFRHLGKRDVLGRYSIHFHLAGNSMRGTSVVGASIWDSHNRWITIHGTNYLVVRDCVGYRSIGHGFFLEDGTEVLNVLDRNLGVMALQGNPLPNQVLPFDHNEGAAFWWANCLNTFTRNVAVECDTYGFRFEATDADGFDPGLFVQRADGTQSRYDIRTLPFVRFQDNEAHTQRRFGLNLRGMPLPSRLGDFATIVREGHIGPQRQEPLQLANIKLWDSLWPYHAGTPGVEIKGMTIHRSTYGIWRSILDRHSFSGLKFSEISNHDIHQSVSVPQAQSQRADYYRYELNPQDRHPPATVINTIKRIDSTAIEIRGYASDNGQLQTVAVNGEPATLQDDYGRWRIVTKVTGSEPLQIEARSVDAAGNREPTPHTMRWDPSQHDDDSGHVDRISAVVPAAR